MIVVSMTNCPPKLRGDLSKWLLEINTGVYVGQVNARVREALWKRICENINDGQATMVFSTNNEQHMDFYVHNTLWKPVDLDGIKLMKHPDKRAYDTKDELPINFSNEAKRLMGKRRRKKTYAENYIILSVILTDSSTDGINTTEIGAIECSDGKVINEYRKALYDNSHVSHTESPDIKNNNEICRALNELFDFIGNKPVLLYDEAFTLGLLKNEAKKNSIDFPKINYSDIINDVKSKLNLPDDNSPAAIAKALDIEIKTFSNAIDHCCFLHNVYLKLNKFQ